MIWQNTSSCLIKEIIPWLEDVVELNVLPLNDWLCFIWFRLADISDDVRSLTSVDPFWDDVSGLMLALGPAIGVSWGWFAIRFKFSESASIFCFWFKLRLALDPASGELMSGTAEVPNVVPCCHWKWFESYPMENIYIYKSNLIVTFYRLPSIYYQTWDQ